jgi:hypothetical protein
VDGVLFFFAAQAGRLIISSAISRQQNFTNRAGINLKLDMSNTLTSKQPHCN